MKTRHRSSLVESLSVMSRGTNIRRYLLFLSNCKRYAANVYQRSHLGSARPAINEGAMRNKSQSQRRSPLRAQDGVVDDEVEVCRVELAMVTLIVDADSKEHNTPNIVLAFRIRLSPGWETDIDLPRGSGLM